MVSVRQSTQLDFVHQTDGSPTVPIPARIPAAVPNVPALVTTTEGLPLIAHRLLENSQPVAGILVLIAGDCRPVLLALKVDFSGLEVIAIMLFLIFQKISPGCRPDRMVLEVLEDLQDLTIRDLRLKLVIDFFFHFYTDFCQI